MNPDQDRRLVEAVKNLLDAFAPADSPGAIVMVIRNGQPVVSISRGLANLETGIPITSQTNFRLASVTKQFTAMAILLLKERQLLGLDDSITRYFPGFPNGGGSVTIRHLLNHTSGLLDYEDLIPAGTSLAVTDDHVLRLLIAASGSYFVPGTHYRYSNTGYCLLGSIVEIVTGQTFSNFLKRNIFDPLGMRNSLAFEAGRSLVSHRAYGYTGIDLSFERTDQSVTSSTLGDGGIYSSINDLLLWDQAITQSGLVSAPTQAEAFTPGASTQHQIMEDAGTQVVEYGFGWFLGNYRNVRTHWHSGNSIGFTNRIERFPELGLTVILLCNRNEAPLSILSRQIVELFVPETN